MQAIASPSSLKVFLVDDSPLICQRLSTLLGAIPGVQVIGTAATQDEARQLESNHADVAIVDMQLRDGSGINVLRNISASGRAIVPIVLTNYADAQFRRQCLQEGARFFFDKSTEFGRVRDTIRQMAEARSAGHPGASS
ncbi:response regulator transcription factor [Pigmentiphaga soli]|uniref:Response regulator transcription factor n=1 Tax=Pigmentiphaga soli TaxID=1007095 RepID=A0ABP8HSG4_9BURK